MAVNGKQERFNISTGLDPDVLDSIHKVLKDWTEHAELDQDLQVALAAVFEELCTNVMEHSHANWLELALAWFDDGVIMSMGDNGAEFDPKKMLEDQQSGKSQKKEYRNLGLDMIKNLSRNFYYIRDPAGINRTVVELPRNWDHQATS